MPFRWSTILCETTGRRNGDVRKYTVAVNRPLVTPWRAADCIRGKRLAPFRADSLAVLERHNARAAAADQPRHCGSSAPSATARRETARARHDQVRRFAQQTDPDTHLCDWNGAQPRLLEVDLVAHCGSSTDGEYLSTLVVTDIHTTWAECVALLNRSQQTISEAIAQVCLGLPFPLRGLDSADGSEFINANLWCYCQDEHLAFTRSRPNKKNDHVLLGS